MLGNALPLPGGIGGVDGGMIGAFTAFGVPVQLAVVAVLAYRASRSGCRRCPARWPTSSCAARWPRWRTERGP